jgi:hypothetical protein
MSPTERIFRGKTSISAGTTSNDVHAPKTAVHTAPKSIAANVERIDLTRLKIRDGWRGGAWLRVEGGFSWKVRNRACQPFTASLG